MPLRTSLEHEFEGQHRGRRHRTVAEERASILKRPKMLHSSSFKNYILAFKRLVKQWAAAANRGSDDAGTVDAQRVILSRIEQHIDECTQLRQTEERRQHAACIRELVDADDEDDDGVGEHQISYADISRLTRHANIKGRQQEVEETLDAGPPKLEQFRFLRDNSMTRLIVDNAQRGEAAKKLTNRLWSRRKYYKIFIEGGSAEGNDVVAAGVPACWSHYRYVDSMMRARSSSSAVQVGATMQPPLSQPRQTEKKKRARSLFRVRARSPAGDRLHVDKEGTTDEENQNMSAVKRQKTNATSGSQRPGGSVTLQQQPTTSRAAAAAGISTKPPQQQLKKKKCPPRIAPNTSDEEDAARLPLRRRVMHARRAPLTQQQQQQSPNSKEELSIPEIKKRAAARRVRDIQVRYDEQMAEGMQARVDEIAAQEMQEELDASIKHAAAMLADAEENAVRIGASSPVIRELRERVANLRRDRLARMQNMSASMDRHSAVQRAAADYHRRSGRWKPISSGDSSGSEEGLYSFLERPPGVAKPKKKEGGCRASKM
uniref:Uncharacterized protein n=1 Tax=Globodera rostochiensis TaxID=31243 RepID=A0A914IGA8_GLORO